MSYNVTIFGIHLKLSPIAFSIPIGSGHWDIYWYGIIIATGFLLALIYGLKNAPRYGLNSDRMLDVILVATPVAILSARTYYVIFDGETPLLGVNIYDAVCRRGYIITAALSARLRRARLCAKYAR